MTSDAVPPNDGRRDVERAVAELSDRLPSALLPLARLTYNYRWSWLSGGDSLFHDIDPTRWRRSGSNPRSVLEAVPPRRLHDLARDASYVERVQSAGECIDGDLLRPAWCTGTITPDRPVAYFCSEFGIHCSLPLYGGGLGVLAGDTLKAASDLAFPMVGVGLLYREGNFHQRLDPSGWQHEYWVPTDFARLPAVRVTGPDYQPLTVEVVLRRRVVRIQIWRVDVGRVPLYLLDTDLEDNHSIDRWITARLYVGDRHIRLTQYGVLGIGGVRALEALGITPALLHLNEGHAALSSLARAQRLAAEGQSFDAALEAVRRETVFTTHTPIAAGNEGYSWQEVEPVFSDFADGLGIPRSTFYDVGRVAPGNEHEPVSITPLALRTSRAAIGVSRRHGEVARQMWHPLWPARPVEEVPISYVTNGVHALTWMSLPMQQLLDRHLPQWRTALTDRELWKGIEAIPDVELWAVRCQLREALVAYSRERSIQDRISRGDAPDYVDAAARVFSSETLTLGFARRVAMYKRLYLMGRLPDNGLTRLLADGPQPIQLIAAGKGHPQDNEAKETLRNGFRLKEIPGLGSRVVYLEDYDLHMAQCLVAGADLWLNLPRPPLEASGTSGMKVVLNGGLNLSVLDGWWLEGYDGTNGWAIDSPPGDPQMQDEHDARVLLDLLEHQVIPLFYDRDADGIPRRWVQKIKASMRTLIPQFVAQRMVREYIEKLYT